MKVFPLLFCAGAILCGCQAMPDLSDTTNATLRFRIHYQAPGIGTPMVEISTTTSTMASRCVYVNELFGIAANVSDPGGIRSIVIGPSQFPASSISVRTNPGDTIAIPSPAEKTQGDPVTPFPNPGSPADSAVVQAVYSTAKAFDTVTLLGTYQFHGTSRVAMRATARNWGQTTGVSEVYHFYLEKAQPSDPARQAGMSCPVP